MLTRRQTIKLLASTGMLTLATPLAGCTISIISDSDASSTFRTLDEIKSSGVLRVGVLSDTNPFSYVDENGNFTGYEIELAKRLAKDMGVEANLVITESSNRLMFLQNHKIDMLIANFSISEKRKKKVDFTYPYMRAAVGVASHTSNVLTDIADIGNRPAIVAVGSATEIFLVENYPDLNFEKYDGFSNARTAFENNESAVWFAHNIDLMAFTGLNPDKYTVGIYELGENDFLAPSVAKGNETLLEWLNSEMLALGEERFFHWDYEQTMLATYGAEYEELIVVEPGQD